MLSICVALLNMPQTFHYPPVFKLASPPRMASFQATFGPCSDSELYGAYIWVQHVVGALYPITQHVEISLRNAIDRDVRRRLHDYWWRLPQFATSATADLVDNFDKAERTLTRAWRNAERKRLGLPAGGTLPVTSIAPIWSHDKIVAATDFSTWEYVLRDDFTAANHSQNHLYPWPLSMTKCFKQYSLLDTSSPLARKKLGDLVREIREYRNRLFHHDKIWLSISPAPSMNVHTAISSIRHKINQMELLLNVIDPRVVDLLNRTGVLPNARRVCTLNELQIYRFAHTEQPFTRRKKRVLRSVIGRARNANVTEAWEYGGALFGIYRIR